MKKICLVADAARARIYAYEQTRELDGPHDVMREVCDLVDLARRQRTDEHRHPHLDQLDAAFAKEIAVEVERITRELGVQSLIVVASSRMLGELRKAFSSLRRTLTISELARDFTKLSMPELRDHLAVLDLLPSRPRLAFANR